MPFTDELNREELRKKIEDITTKFIQKFDAKKVLNRRELHTILRQIIQPEHVFQVRKSTYSLDREYNAFMKELSHSITPISTNLQQWALRFLTSESLILALPILDATDVDGKSFNQLTPEQKKKALEPVVAVIMKRFFTNLRAAKKRYKLAIPGNIDAAVRYKISRFLQEKFIATFD